MIVRAVGVGLLLCCGLLAARIAIEEPASPVRPTTRTVSAGSSQVITPRTWRRLSAGVDHVVWGRTDRTQTVTLAELPAGAAPLLEIARGSALAMRDEVPGYRFESLVALQNGSVVVHRFRAGSGAIHVAQVWRRSADAETDAVATWTASRRPPAVAAGLVPEFRARRTRARE